MACKALSKVRIGVIGLGMRGSEAVSRLLQVEGTEIVALCHLLQEQSRIGRYCYSVNFYFLNCTLFILCKHEGRNTKHREANFASNDFGVRWSRLKM